MRARVSSAISRARRPILWTALAYALGVSAGMVMAHTGNRFAVRHRDELVGAAFRGKTLGSLQAGFPVKAALYDFAGNLILGAVPSTVMGLGILMPFPVACYRGWIGGIVSIDGEHRSRFGDWHEGIYYLGVLVLQLIPYSLAGGAGVRLGLGYVFPKGRFGYVGRRWFGFPVAGLQDVGWIYTLVVPLFLIASLVEFLAR